MENLCHHPQTTHPNATSKPSWHFQNLCCVAYFHVWHTIITSTWCQMEEWTSFRTTRKYQIFASLIWTRTLVAIYANMRQSEGFRAQQVHIVRSDSNKLELIRVHKHTLTHSQSIVRTTYAPVYWNKRETGDVDMEWRWVRIIMKRLPEARASVLGFRLAACSGWCFFGLPTGDDDLIYRQHCLALNLTGKYLGVLRIGQH